MMSQKKYFMTKDRSFYKSFLKLTAALMLQQAVVLSVNLADNVMLGSYSETALSGVAAVNQIQFVLQQVVFGVSNGMVILASQYWGQKKTEPIRKLLSCAVWCAAGLAVLFFAIVSAAPHWSVGLFTNEQAIVGEGVKYLNIVRFSYLFFALSTVLLGGMRVVEKVKIAFYTSAIALVINCSINYTLIKGHFGMPELGVQGAAIGTLVARVIECAIVAVYVFRKDKLLQVQIPALFRIDRGLARDYFEVMLPVLANSFLWGLNTALQTVILGHMSASAIAAHSISSTIYLFLKVMAVGACSSASVLVGKTIGMGEPGKVKEYVRTLQVLFVGIGALLMGILLLIRVPFLGLYVLTPETEALTNIFLIIEAIVLLVMSYQMGMNVGVICGGGDSRYLLIVDTVGIWVIGLPLSFISAFVWKSSPVVVLLFLNIDQFLKCIPAFIYGNSYRWVRSLTKNE